MVEHTCNPNTWQVDTDKPIIQTLGKWTLEDQKFKSKLTYLVSLEPLWATQYLVLSFNITYSMRTRNSYIEEEGRD